ncbi:MAG: crossover junction endodeoxyribonuclease RuvC [Myxococcales bacterium]|nr:crossover junction endodeoxyribonuclease RuvC [Myxococcales bacterium]MCB9533429.1 crossover junction endodeoxyribonuclease RuvC [Myxococcales bacterium]
MRPDVRVLGIDPGSIRMGWGIVEQSGGRLSRVASGVVRCGERPLPERLELIYEAITVACRTHSPTSAAIEGIFHQRSAQSALVLGHARGAALLALRHAKVPVFEYAPALVKKSVTGRGRADKSQVDALVGAMLGRFAAETHDETDALAIAICHVHHAADALQESR